MTCNSRCWFAKSEPDKCKCSCYGANHGHGHPEKNEQKLSSIILTEAEAIKFREQMTNEVSCYCGYKELRNSEIRGYLDSDGWNIRNEKYWLWVHCPECDHDWSIWKLGVPRESELVKKINSVQKGLGDF